MNGLVTAMTELPTSCSGCETLANGQLHKMQGKCGSGCLAVFGQWMAPRGTSMEHAEGSLKGESVGMANRKNGGKIAKKPER